MLDTAVPCCSDWRGSGLAQCDRRASLRRLASLTPRSVDRDMAAGSDFDGANRLLKARLELADPVQQLADEHGAGVVEPEVEA